MFECIELVFAIGVHFCRIAYIRSALGQSKTEYSPLTIPKT